MKLIKSICKEVAFQLGQGHSERVYQEAVSVSFYLNRIHYLKELTIPVHLRGFQIGEMRADLVVPGKKMVIECKAVRSNLNMNNLPQLIKYMKALKYQNGILVNFNKNINKEPVEFITITQETTQTTEVQETQEDSRDTYLVSTDSGKFEIKF
jgi:GxxExxY protein